MWKWPFIACTMLTTALNAETKVLAFSGSTREDSVNKKLLLEAVSLAREMGAEVTVVDLKDYPLPFYDADFEAKEGMPEKAKELRRLLVQSQAILIASPEYNGSVSAVLKNVIDWVSRGENGQPSRDAFKGKKVVLLSASPGPTGGLRGLVHLKAIVENIGGNVLPKQFSLPQAYNAFDEQNHLKNQKTREELRQLVQKLGS